MKVNHAGEHGAVRIYTGKIFMARFTAKSLLPEFLAFKADDSPSSGEDDRMGPGGRL